MIAKLCLGAVFCFLAMPAAKADSSLSGFISVDDQGTLGATIAGAWSSVKQFEFWNISSSIKTNAAFGSIDHLLDDADVTASVTAKTDLQPGVQLALDAEYIFERDYIEGFAPTFDAIDHSHIFDVAAGLEFEQGSLQHNLDLGSKFKIHQDLMRIGFADFVREHQDYFEPELSWRATYDVAAAFDVFVETALVNRQYLKDRDELGRQRHFWGPDLIFAVALEGAVTGDLGVMVAYRQMQKDAAENLTVVAPYVELAGKIGEATEIKFTASGGIEQSVMGAPELYRYYGASLEVTQALSEQTKWRLTGGGLIEALPDGRMDTLDAGAELEWRVNRHASFVTGIGVQYLKVELDKSEVTPFAKIGINLKL